MRHGVFTGYSWGTRGIYVCVGYVSAMYRLCVGNVTEETRSEGVNKEDYCPLKKQGIFIKTKITLFNNENNLEATMETKNILWRKRQEI